MNKLYNFFLVYIFFFTLNLYAANELFINGSNSVSAIATLKDSTCIVFVNGEIKNADALFVNSGGAIELTGNWTNTVANNKYQSTGVERFYGTTEQIISGVMNGTTKSTDGYDNQFFNLKVYRNSSITTTPNKYITVSNNVNVANTIDFELTSPNPTYSGSGINRSVIRTDALSPSNVGTYANEIYLLNPSVNALTNYATLSSNGQDRYIEGKLRRQVNAAATYDFPVGFIPTFKDGMEGYSLTFNSAPTSKSILGYIEDSSQAVLCRNILCDVGQDPGPGNDPFTNCVGPPDGIFDWYYLDPTNDLTHDWRADASDAIGTINYNITLYPGSSLDPLSKYRAIPTACGNPYQTKLIRVVAKDGIVGGTSQLGPGSWAPFGTLTSYIWCDFSPAATQPITLAGQTSFSKFRIHGTNLYTSTVLPVELTSFTLMPINNSYFKLNWQTASEFNCSGFEIERSIDGITFNSIGFINGNGTTNLPHSYTLNDENIVVETNYYYRLKIIDIDKTYKYTNILLGRLNGGDQVVVSNFYPNPTQGQTALDIFTPLNTTMTTTVYDVLGQIVQRTENNLTRGFNKIEYDLSTLANATYMIDCRISNQKITKKLVKF